jgi:hypothetical protein
MRLIYEFRLWLHSVLLGWCVSVLPEPESARFSIHVLEWIKAEYPQSQNQSAEHEHLWRTPSESHAPSLRICGHVCECGAYRIYRGPAYGWQVVQPPTYREIR